MNRQDICDMGYDDVIVFSGNTDYDGCIVGVTIDNQAVYSKSRMLQYLMKNGADEEEALDWIEYNTQGSLGFEGSPIILEIDEFSQMYYNEGWRSSMWDKIKAFFSNKITKTVAWVILVLDVAVLLFGGATELEITNGVVLVVGVVSALTLLINFICERTVKKK